MDDKISEQLNAAGDTVEAYYCEKRLANNEFEDLIVPYYYDLVYPCGESPEEGRDFVAASLLSRSKDAFLPDERACYTPRDPWFARLASSPEDSFADFECQELLGACCTVVAGNMTFTKMRPAEQSTMIKWVAANLNDPTVAPGYNVAYIGSQLDFPSYTEPSLQPPSTDGDEIVIPSNKDPVVQPEQPPKDSEFTMVGILILIGMIMIFITTVLLILKRRQKYLTGKDVDAAIAQSELHMDKGGDLAGEHIETATWEDRTFDDQDTQDLEINVLSDGNHLHVRDVSNISFHTKEGYERDPRNSAGRSPYQAYRFDVGSSYKNGVMGAYGADLFGPTEITVVPPYPMEPHSESEADRSETDSWAQTDGDTIGSLEDDHRLTGPIEPDVGEI
eukprot:scaffold1400_cov175-Amphora_coffeaeformis.AAC.3